MVGKVNVEHLINRDDNMHVDKLEQLGPEREKSTLKSPAMIILAM